MNDAFATHEVFNQSPPFEDVNLFTSDRALHGGGEPGGWQARGQAADGLRRRLRQR